MVAPRRKNNEQKKSLILGVGLDQQDEHKRITKGENFCLVGGSEETHERMTETAIKVNEKLSQKGKKLEDISPPEFAELLRESTPE